MSASQPRSNRASPRIVVIGGGTGSFTILQALKMLTPSITALVNMADDGGSTGVLRDELGVLPPGDVRQCLVALSEAPEEMRELFNFRFGEGTLAGHSFGNLFLSAVEKMTDNFADAVRMASDLLRITGRVVPITLDNVRLVLEAGGDTVHGEHRIDIMQFDKAFQRPRLSLDPRAFINPEARTAIEQADLLIIAPGDIYTSLGPLLIVDGVAEALQRTAAKIVYVCNLVVKPGQTTGFTVADHAAEIERFVAGPVLDYVLYNTAQPSQQLMSKYAREGELAVEFAAEDFKGLHYMPIGTSLLARVGAQPNQNDVTNIPRTFIRHDAVAVARAVRELIRV